MCYGTCRSRPHSPRLRLGAGMGGPPRSSRCNIGCTTVVLIVRFAGGMSSRPASTTAARTEGHTGRAQQAGPDQGRPQGHRPCPDCPQPEQQGSCCAAFTRPNAGCSCCCSGVAPSATALPSRGRSAPPIGVVITGCLVVECSCLSPSSSWSAQKEIRGVIKSYKYKPTDLRDKKTRAIRRRLTASEVRAVIVAAFVGRPLCPAVASLRCLTSWFRPRSRCPYFAEERQDCATDKEGEQLPPASLRHQGLI